MNRTTAIGKIRTVNATLQPKLEPRPTTMSEVHYLQDSCSTWSTSSHTRIVSDLHEHLFGNCHTLAIYFFLNRGIPMQMDALGCYVATQVEEYERIEDKTEASRQKEL